MGLFDRFKKKPESAKAPDSTLPQWPQPPQTDTMCLLLMDRVLDGVAPAVEAVRAAFGPDSVSDIDESHPRVPAFIATVDGLQFWVSYLPMPVPPQTEDIATAAKYALLLTDEEKQAVTAHKSFWMLAQKGGGTSLSEKRRVCWTFSALLAALMGLEGAIGAHPVNRGGLLVSKRHCLQQWELMEDKDPQGDFFPVPLWVWVYGTYQGEAPIIRTTGLQDFGLPELGFYKPEREVGELLDLLYSMACLQITEKQLYRNRALIPLDEKTEVVCKQDGDVLFFIGA